MQQPSLVECLYHQVILLRLVLIPIDRTILVADVIRYPHRNHAHAKIASLLIAKLRNQERVHLDSNALVLANCRYESIVAHSLVNSTPKEMRRHQEPVTKN
jgi:hypothetical protein